MTHALRMFLAGLVVAMFGVTGARAQDAGETAQPGAEAQEASHETPVPLTIPAGPSWSSDEIAKVGDMLKGTWKTTAPVAERDGSAGAEIVMSVVPVRTVDIPDAMYVEVARTDSIRAPYRRALFQLAADGGGVVLRSLSASTPEGNEALNQLTGFWTCPDVLPLLTSTNLKLADFDTTMELGVSPFKQGPGYTARTAHAFPASGMAAVEMTSELSLQPDVLTTADRGLDKDGQVVWGPKPGEKYTFTRYNSPLPVVDRREGGLILLWYNKSEQAPLLSDEYRYYAHYASWLAGGAALESSRARSGFKPGGPFGFKQIKNVALPTIKAWKEAFRGVGNLSSVRMLVPPELGYRDKGVVRKGVQIVPPNAVLVFEVEILGIEPAKVPEALALPEGVKVRPKGAGGKVNGQPR